MARSAGVRDVTPLRGVEVVACNAFGQAVVEKALGVHAAEDGVGGRCPAQVVQCRPEMHPGRPKRDGAAGIPLDLAADHPEEVERKDERVLPPRIAVPLRVPLDDPAEGPRIRIPRALRKILLLGQRAAVVQLPVARRVGVGNVTLPLGLEVVAGSTEACSLDEDRPIERCVRGSRQHGAGAHILELVRADRLAAERAAATPRGRGRLQHPEYAAAAEGVPAGRPARPLEVAEADAALAQPLLAGLHLCDAGGGVKAWGPGRLDTCRA
mmetsp:Transcript_91455/g.286095  ORF Transcript_91455/g.286095 Transcript_91455/m.286095 type:complete len:268 (+) Transcript_91455:532-1335(+)